MVKKRKKTFEIISPVPRYVPAHRRWATFAMFAIVLFIIVMTLAYNLDDLLFSPHFPNIFLAPETYSLQGVDYEKMASWLPVTDARIYAIHLQAQKREDGLTLSYVPYFYFCSASTPTRGWRVKLVGEGREVSRPVSFFNPPDDCGDVLADSPIDMPDAFALLQAKREQSLSLTYEKWPDMLSLEFNEQGELIWKAKYRKIFDTRKYEMIVINAVSGE